MDGQKIVNAAKQKFSSASERFSEELKKLRTGRASAALLDGIMVLAYGTPMPLNQVASIAAPEAQLLQITPFDPANIQAIASAIREDQALGLNPMDDGHVVRVPIPPLTEERRREIAKTVGARQEDTMIGLRGVRHDAMAEIDKLQKSKQVGEDEAKRLQKQIDDLMASSKASVEALASDKVNEIMTL